MASKRTKEQCMIWLKSKAADENSLDGINAQLVLNVLEEKEKRLEKLGIQFKMVENDRNRLREVIDIFTSDHDLTDEEKQHIYEQYGIEIFNF